MPPLLSPPAYTATRQMLPNSDFLSMLRPRYPLIADRVTCIYTPTDNVLLKAANALLIQVSNSHLSTPLIHSTCPLTYLSIYACTQDKEAMDRAIACPTLGHAHLLFGDEAHDLILEQLGLGFSDPTDWGNVSNVNIAGSVAAAAGEEQEKEKQRIKEEEQEGGEGRDAPSPT